MLHWYSNNNSVGTVCASNPTKTKQTNTQKIKHAYLPQLCVLDYNHLQVNKDTFCPACTRVHYTDQTKHLAHCRLKSYSSGIIFLEEPCNVIIPSGILSESIILVICTHCTCTHLEGLHHILSFFLTVQLMCWGFSSVSRDSRKRSHFAFMSCLNLNNSIKSKDKTRTML